MLVHLRNNKQIVEYWPLFREKINEYFPELTRKHPMYANNILTHALTHSDIFQLCLFYSDADLSMPHSLFILDVHGDALLSCKEMTVLLWAAVTPQSNQNIQEVAEQLTDWAKAWDCKYLKAQTASKRIAEKEAAILSKFVKQADYNWGLFCEL